MEGLRFHWGGDTADPDVRLLSEDDIEQAKREGEQRKQEETAEPA